MHIELRKRGKVTLYYLAHSLRLDGKVRKVRIYLGANLSKPQILEKWRLGEERLNRMIESRKAVRDPFEIILSKKEIEELKNIQASAKIKVIHLSEEDWRKFTETFAYDTNAIEGSTLEQNEVTGILEKGKWPEKKPREEIAETYGVAKAINFLRTTREHLSLELILKLHQLVFENSKVFAGKFRKKGVEVVITDGLGNVVHKGAPATQVRSMLEQLMEWYKNNKSKYPAIVLAAVVHNQFENIHPFQDGNGRVGRLLLNNILMKRGFPPVNIELKNRDKYYASLQAYESKHDLRPTIELILKEYRALKKFLRKM